MLDIFAPIIKAAPKWTLADALPLIIRIEAICPAFGCHLALTGGTLYKPGPRKDLDLLFYRIRQRDYIDEKGLLAALAAEGVEIGKTFGWVTKATFAGKGIDLFFPERPNASESGTY